MADLIPPNRTLVKQALDVLEAEGFTEWIKAELKGELTELDFQSGDVGQIATQVAAFRTQAQALDLFMDKLREYIQ
jgi:hypothetical protein